MQKWLWSIALKKGLRVLVMGLIAWIAANNTDKVGVSVDIDPDKLMLFLLGALEIARNKVKHKLGEISEKK